MQKLVDKSGKRYYGHDFKDRLEIPEINQEIIRNYIFFKELNLLATERESFESGRDYMQVFRENVHKFLINAVYSQNLLDDPYDMQDHTKEKLAEYLHFMRKKSRGDRMSFHWEYNLSKMIQMGMPIKMTEKEKRAYLWMYEKNVELIGTETEKTPEYNIIKINSRAGIVNIRYDISRKVRASIKKYLENYIEEKQKNLDKTIGDLRENLDHVKDEMLPFEYEDEIGMSEKFHEFLTGEIFDLGLLTAAKRGGLHVPELPVEWLDMLIKTKVESTDPELMNIWYGLQEEFPITGEGEKLVEMLAKYEGSTGFLNSPYKKLYIHNYIYNLHHLKDLL